MLRVSAACEYAGIPSVSLVCEGFISQATTTSVGLGFPNLALAVVPGHPSVQSKDELRRNIHDVTCARVIDGLTRHAAEVVLDKEYGPHDVVFAGTFDEVNDIFYEREWSDGLPIVPPTLDKVRAFLAFVDRDPDESLGVVLPDSRAATIWSIAVNGVMAGCRPEYMPILVALVEAMCDPAYGVEHSGNTPGSETLIILNGPIIKALGFNFEQGVLRDGFRPNTSIGRFWRLYLRNVAGFLPHRNDKGTFGNTWRVVLAENEDVLRRIGWEPNSVEMGFQAGDNTVTIARYSGGNVMATVTGSTPEEILPYLADRVVKENSWQLIFTAGHAHGSMRPLLLLTPILAETIARAGWSKQDVKQYLFDHARLPASQFERYALEWTDHRYPTLVEAVRLGKAPRAFAESDDPERLVPIVYKPGDFMIAVTGDPMRTNAYTFSHNGVLGYTVGKRIRLPEKWEPRLAERRR